MTEDQSNTDEEPTTPGGQKVEFRKNRYWSDQIEAIARELSMLAIACDIPVFEPGIAERILKGDEGVCRRRNPAAFKKIRKHLMGLMPLEKAAIDRLGVNDTKEILDQVRGAIIALRSAGKPGSAESK
jgi:hypothetical protein